MSKHDSNQHTNNSVGGKPKMIVIYALFVALAVWLALVTVQTAEPAGEWACIQQVCVADEPGGELWAQENCGLVDDPETGQQVEACQITINGQTQIVPRAELNLSSIRNCLEFACVQEVRVRDVNYTITNETS